MPPHTPHMPIVQRRPVAAQKVLAPTPQQGWPMPPQVTPVALLHEPFMQVPAAPPQDWPLPAQTRAPPCPMTQQPPALQALAAQHACPAAPQGALPPGAPAAPPAPPVPAAPPAPLGAPGPPSALTNVGPPPHAPRPRAAAAASTRRAPGPADRGFGEVGDGRTGFMWAPWVRCRQCVCACP